MNLKIFFLLLIVVISQRGVCQVGEQQVIFKDNTLSFEYVDIRISQTAAPETISFEENGKSINSPVFVGADSSEKTSMAEEFFIEHLTSPVRNKNGSLEIMLQSGVWHPIRTETDLPSAAYRLEKQFDEIGFYAIKGEHLDGTFYLLVNAQTGKSFPVIGEPHLSPDYKWILCSANRISDNFRINGFQLIAHHEGNLREIVNHKNSTWGIKKAKWQDNSSIIIQADYLGKSTTPLLRKITLQLDIIFN